MRDLRRSRAIARSCTGRRDTDAERHDTYELSHDPLTKACAPGTNLNDKRHECLKRMSSLLEPQCRVKAWSKRPIS
jgi:hypothetical protein